MAQIGIITKGDRTVWEYANFVREKKLNYEFSIFK